MCFQKFSTEELKAYKVLGKKIMPGEINNKMYLL